MSLIGLGDQYRSNPLSRFIAAICSFYITGKVVEHSIVIDRSGIEIDDGQ